MKCKQCESTLTGRQREFCSDKCRKQASRTKSGPQDAPQSTNADKMAVERGQTERGHTSRTSTDPSKGFTWVPGETVYGRRAVSYPHDTFETRPEPLSHTDIPDPRNRCIYQGQDGTRYLLDATGNQHERPQPTATRPTCPQGDEQPERVRNSP